MRRLGDAIATLRARLALARCDEVGDGARVRGRPFVDSRGSITIGEHVFIGSIPVRSHLVTGEAGSITIGRGARIAHGVAICAHASITIGEDTVIDPFAILLDVDFHEIDDRGSMGDARPVTIGRDVRIGSGVVILRGAVLEDGVSVAPNSVVARRIPRGVRVGGVPAKRIA